MRGAMLVLFGFARNKYALQGGKGKRNQNIGIGGRGSGEDHKQATISRLSNSVQDISFR